MHIEIEVDGLTYELDIKGKYSIIHGDSGMGKTTLCQKMIASNSEGRPIKINSDLPVKAVPKTYTEKDLYEIHNHVVIIDEFCDIIHLHNTASILRESDNYFIIISRKLYDCIPLCIENVYEMRTNGEYHWTEQKYKVSGKRSFSGIEHIVTEDKDSGFNFFDHHYDIDVDHADAKSKIVAYLEGKLEENPNYDNVLIVYDAAAFAYQKKNLDDWISEYNINVQMLDWYSFEHHVLEQEPFNIKLTQEGIGYAWESLERAAEAKLKECITYTKRILPYCLQKENYCLNCTKKTSCNYEHSGFSPGITIEPKNGLKIQAEQQTKMQANSKIEKMEVF